MSMALNLSSIEAICHVLLLLLWRQWRMRHKWNLLLLLLLLWLLLWWLLLLLLCWRWRRWLQCKVNMWLLLRCKWKLWLLLGLLEVLLERVSNAPQQH